MSAPVERVCERSLALGLFARVAAKSCQQPSQIEELYGAPRKVERSCQSLAITGWRRSHGVSIDGVHGGVLY